MDKKKMLCAMAASFMASFGCSAQKAEQQAVTAEAGKILIAYYSKSGNTGFAAGQIARATGGTLFEIQPVNDYPDDYNACVEQAKREIQDNFRPEIEPGPENLDQYDVIFIGSPNWWSTIAPPVASFLAGHDLAGKTIAPFVTHGGGGMAGCEEAVKQLCPDSTILKGGAFSGRNVRRNPDEVIKWANKTVSVKPAE